jgi:hypothetical protein
MPFDDFWRLERATNVLVGNVPKVGPLKPGMRVKVY